MFIVHPCKDMAPLFVQISSSFFRLSAEAAISDAMLRLYIHGVATNQSVIANIIVV